MAGFVDRNLLIGLMIASLLALAGGWLLQRVPVHPWVVVAQVERAPAVWVESRHFAWQPRAAVPDRALAAGPASAGAVTTPPVAEAPAVTPRVHVGAPAAGRSTTAAPQVAPPRSAAPADVEVAVQAVAAAPGVPGAGVESDHGHGAGAAANLPAGGGPGSGDALGSGSGSGRAGAGGDGAAPLGLEQVDVPPKPIHVPQPAFPPAAEREGLEAEVTLVLVIAPDGSVRRAHATCAACDPRFLSVTRETAKLWRFAPAQLHGQPVAVQVSQRIHFALDD